MSIFSCEYVFLFPFPLRFKLQLKTSPSICKNKAEMWKDWFKIFRSDKCWLYCKIYFEYVVWKYLTKQYRHIIRFRQQYLSILVNENIINRRFTFSPHNNFKNSLRKAIARMMDWIIFQSTIWYFFSKASHYKLFNFIL